MTTTEMLTREQILALPAGRELDALVAEKVMGWTQIANGPEKGNWLDAQAQRILDAGYGVSVKHKPDPFSTHIAAAWQVVERMMKDGDVFIEWWNDNEWFVSPKPLIIRQTDGTRKGAAAPTVTFAICRAALLATLEK